MTRILFAFFLLFNITIAFSQDLVFFDKNGKSTSEAQAFYVRKKVSGDSYKSTYVNGGAPYFEGRIINPSITDEAKNVYSGPVTWFYKNGRKKALRTFNEKGVETGTSIYYYESGRVWKEIEYNNGVMVDNRFKEYDEDGRATRIFEEEFVNNYNDWDIYLSDKSESKINNSSFELLSLTKEGTSRFISCPSRSPEYIIEALINITDIGNEHAGIIFHFKDWDNYSFFFISKRAFYTGYVYEGVTAIKADGMYSGAIKENEVNNLKIICDGDKNIYSINGEIQYSSDRQRQAGSNLGFATGGKSKIIVDRLVYKEVDFKSGGGAAVSNADIGVKGTGSGLLFTTSGYIFTNYHVVENATKITIEGTFSDKVWTATVVQKDMDNDLAILKISDQEFRTTGPIQYSFKESGGAEVGSSVFTIGFPFALSGMGKEAKFSDGKVSSKTGYNNALNTYQTTIPVQPGNSGGPLFNEKGELVGLMNAKIFGADNVSYAVKLNYLRNLIDVLPETVEIPKSPLLPTPLEDKIKILTNYVVLIKVK